MMIRFNMKSRARLTGALYLPYAFASVPLALRGKLIVATNAAATGANILASETLYRVTVLTDLIAYVVYMAITYLFYTLVRDVNRDWARFGTIVTFAGLFGLTVATMSLMLPLLLLKGTIFHALSLAQRQELALLVLQQFSQCYSIVLFFFGVQWMVMGPLFARIIPRPIGWWLAIGGVAWVALSAAVIVEPALVPAMRQVVIALGGGAELALALWLLIKGVDESRVESASRRR